MITSEQKIAECGVRPSLQRVAILNYLMSHKTHPTADEIYMALVPEMQTLSRMTVYNTLATLAKNGVIQVLDIDSSQMHYDGDTSPHAHFMCTECGKIHDIMPTEKGWRKVQKTAPAPEGATVKSVQLLYKGICADCNKN